jgi:acyl-CoA thioester hydrolase
VKASLPLRSSFTFFHPLRVRWGEVDRQDVVFNPNYFVYFDVTVGEYWRAIGFPYPAGLEGKSDIFAVDARARFVAPAHYDDELAIGCRTRRLGNTSMVSELAVFRGPELLTAGELVYVHVELASRRPAPLPDALRTAIVRYEATAPEVAS